jgi:hypothetical protein
MTTSTPVPRPAVRRPTSGRLRALLQDVGTPPPGPFVPAPFQDAALQDEVPFREALLRGGWLAPEELDALFDLSAHLRHVDRILARVGVGAPAAPAGEGGRRP